MRVQVTDSEWTVEYSDDAHGEGRLTMVQHRNGNQIQATLRNPGMDLRGLANLLAAVERAAFLVNVGIER